MIARRSGSIITLSTSPRTKRSAQHIPYGPNAAWIEAFTQAAAIALDPFGVRINAAVSGGRVNRRHHFDADKVPYDVLAPVVRYLASKHSQAVTGQVLSAADVPPLVK